VESLRYSCHAALRSGFGELEAVKRLATTKTAGLMAELGIFAWVLCLVFATKTKKPTRVQYEWASWS
jgi:hypothetical protein